MRLPLTGCNGQIDLELQRSLAPLGEVVAVDHAECNLAEPDTVCRLVRTVRPNIIVNPAAYSTVDMADGVRDLAAASGSGQPAAPHPAHQSGGRRAWRQLRQDPLRLAAECDSLAVVADQCAPPSASPALLADFTTLLVLQQTGAPTSSPYGIHDCVPSGETNWCGYAPYAIGVTTKA